MKWLRLLAKLKPEDIQYVQIKLEDIKRDQLQEDLSGAREDSGNESLYRLLSAPSTKRILPLQPFFRRAIPTLVKLFWQREQTQSSERRHFAGTEPLKKFQKGTPFLTR
jgi:hypothetical protein